jgi:hypothetical protein
MKKRKSCWTIVPVLCALISLGLPGTGQDQGFDVIYEGVPLQEPVSQSAFSAILTAQAGFSAAGGAWASAGARAKLTFDPFELHAEGSVGTDGLLLSVGAETFLMGFRMGGDVTFAPGTGIVIDLRGWGQLAAVQLTGNVRLAGAASSITLGASTDLGGFGVSGNVGFAGGALNSAVLGANTQLGPLSLSASGGTVNGQLNVGAGAGIKLGALSLAANAGYDAGLGVNATASAGIRSGSLDASVVALVDNSGVGVESAGQIGLGSVTARFMLRFSQGGVSGEVGGALPLGPLSTTVSVGFDDQIGFSWAEVGVELPL